MELIHEIPLKIKNIDAYVNAFLSEFSKKNFIESASIGGIPSSNAIALWICYFPKEDV